MRVVIDTNVLISAVLKDKSLPALAVHLVEQRGGLLKSEATEQELLRVMARAYLAPLIAAEASEWLVQLMAAAEPVTIIERIAACRDASDNKFLEVAVNGHADVIVSGDADLLTLDPFRGIPIVTPAVFVQAAARPNEAKE